MDERTLDMMVEEAKDIAQSYTGNPVNPNGLLFALGALWERHDLDRDELEQLRGALNYEVGKAEQESLGHNLILSAIRNVN